MKKLAQIFVKSRYGLHIFTNLSTLKWNILKLTSRFRNRDKFNLTASQILFTQLKSCNFDKDWIIELQEPVFYRRVGPTRDVLDTAGSLSDGGRYNIGGAQFSSEVNKLFSRIGAKKSALYLGENKSIVRKEYGDEAVPGSRAITYKIQLKTRKRVVLVDLKKAMVDLAKIIPDLRNIIGSASMNGMWGDLKKPTPSQIWGQWLMHHSTQKIDGLRFPSAHDSRNWNVCLFFKDTKACKKMLIADKTSN